MVVFHVAVITIVILLPVALVVLLFYYFSTARKSKNASPAEIADGAFDDDSDGSDR